MLLNPSEEMRTADPRFLLPHQQWISLGALNRKPIHRSAVQYPVHKIWRTFGVLKALCRPRLHNMKKQPAVFFRKKLGLQNFFTHRGGIFFFGPYPP